MTKKLTSLLSSQQAGLIGIILVLSAILWVFVPSHQDAVTHRQVSNFMQASTLMQMAVETSPFAIMAIGITMVIITGGIDLSVGSIYALAGILTAIILRKFGNMPPAATVAVGLTCCIGIATVGGWLNGAMISKLGVHPFIITLGTMWVYRGIAFVASNGQSILVPDALTNVAKSNLGLGKGLYPVPLLIMLVVTAFGAFYLQKTVMGRRVFAVGGNVEASRYAGLRIGRVLTSVYIITGITVGIAAFVGASYYGSVNSGDAQGYELFVIASAVVGGASLSGGKGSAFGAMLGALLIVLIRTAIRQLHFDQNYEQIIVGIAIVIAVVADQLNRKTAERRMLRARG